MRASRFLKTNQIVKSSKVAQSQNLLSLFNCRLLTIDCRIRDIFFSEQKPVFALLCSLVCHLVNQAGAKGTLL